MRARRLGRRPRQLFGLSVGKRGATTLAIQRSLSGAWTMGQSVYRALTADSTATRNIQGAEASLLVLGSALSGMFLATLNTLMHSFPILLMHDRGQRHLC